MQLGFLCQAPCLSALAPCSSAQAFGSVGAFLDLRQLPVELLEGHFYLARHLICQPLKQLAFFFMNRVSHLMLFYILNPFQPGYETSDLARFLSFFAKRTLFGFLHLGYPVAVLHGL